MKFGEPGQRHPRSGVCGLVKVKLPAIEIDSRLDPLPGYFDSSDRRKEFRVRVRSDLAINAAAGFMRRIQP